MVSLFADVLYGCLVFSQIHLLLLLLLLRRLARVSFQFYPHGDSQSREGHVSVFLKNIMLPQGFAAVKIEGKANT